MERKSAAGLFKRMLCVFAATGLLLGLSSSCDKRDPHGVPKGSTGLRAGINYMQPNKWEYSYKYKVKEIKPIKPIRDKNPSEFNEHAGVVGTGTYEVWFPAPIESDEIRNVQLIYSNPEPTKQVYSEEDGKWWLYYDCAPDDRLPREFEIVATWSFYTFERYVHWDGIDKLIKPYDKDSELYKKYTREEYPILFHKGLVKDATECVDFGKEDDVINTCLNIYNKIISEYMYDYKHMAWTSYGEDGLIPTDRVWLNKRGVCDEFANMFCAMARVNGIPARPICGFAHIPLDEQTRSMSDEEKRVFREMNININENIGPPMGHAWAEFYLEGVGWVPLDATWGNSTDEMPIEVSPMAVRRNIGVVDYYFGKMDPYRLPLFKSWNYELMPAPRTPGAEPKQPWMSVPLSRHSGVKDVVHGFDITHDIPGLAAIANWQADEVLSTLGWEMKNSRFKVIHIADPPKEEVNQLISDIEAEGSNFVNVPAYEWEKSRLETTYISWQ